MKSIIFICLILLTLTLFSLPTSNGAPSKRKRDLGNVKGSNKVTHSVAISTTRKQTTSQKPASTTKEHHTTSATSSTKAKTNPQHSTTKSTKTKRNEPGKSNINKTSANRKKRLNAWNWA